MHKHQRMVILTISHKITIFWEEEIRASGPQILSKTRLALKTATSPTTVRLQMGKPVWAMLCSKFGTTAVLEYVHSDGVL